MSHASDDDVYVGTRGRTTRQLGACELSLANFPQPLGKGRVSQGYARDGGGGVRTGIGWRRCCSAGPYPHTSDPGSLPRYAHDGRDWPRRKSSSDPQPLARAHVAESPTIWRSAPTQVTSSVVHQPVKRNAPSRQHYVGPIRVFRDIRDLGTLVRVVQDSIIPDRLGAAGVRVDSVHPFSPLPPLLLLQLFNSISLRTHDWQRVQLPDAAGDAELVNIEHP